MRKKILLSWSSGKDSAWALHMLLQREDVQVAGLLTTFNQAFGRVAMHAVRRQLVEEQIERIGVPLWPVDLPWPCSNAQYEEIMRGVIGRAQAEDIKAIAFGDLFLQDIRDYRERQMAGSGIEPMFPVWGLPTRKLAIDMIAAGIRAKLTCVDPTKVDRTLAGAEFNLELISRLPEQVDPCGENGEFHTFVYDAPFFAKPIEIAMGEVVESDGFVFADVLPANCKEAES